MPIDRDIQEEKFEDLNSILEKDLYINNYEIKYNNDDKKFIYETGDLVIQFFASNQLNEELNNYLLSQFFSSYIGENNWRLLFYVGIYYGKIDNFLESIRYSSFFYDSGVIFLDFFNDYFDDLIGYFNKEQIKLLLELIRGNYSNWSYNAINNNIGELSRNLIKKLVDYKFSELSKNLVGINIEINKDKEELKQIVNYFGFDTKYNEFLTNLDKHFYSENKDNIEIAGLIGNFRQFTCDIIIDIALKLAKINGLEVYPKSTNKDVKSEIGHARDYIKMLFNFTDYENKFLNNFIEILHNEGGHAFLSSIEYFRLTKNITIEIILMLLYKLREFEENNK